MSALGRDLLLHRDLCIEVAWRRINVLCAHAVAYRNPEYDEEDMGGDLARRGAALCVCVCVCV